MNKIHLIERKGAPIYMRFIFNAGARYDTKHGLAHFVEHMLVAGTEKFPTKDALARYIDVTGGSFSAYTNSDLLCIDIEIAEKSDFDIAIQLIDQIFNHSLFDKQTIEKERGAIITELQKRKSNPEIHIWDIYMKLFFQNTTSGHNIVGDLESINSINHEDLIKFKEKYIRFDNCSLIVAGDLDKDLLLEKLGKINIFLDKTVHKPVEILPIYNDKKILAENAPIEQSYFMFGTRIKPLSLSERATLGLAITYLASGRSGKLIEELRYKRGFVYNLNGNIISRNDYATWTINTSVSPKNLNETLSVIIDNINQLRQKALSAETLKYLKSKIIKSYIIKLQSSEAVVDNNQTGFLATEQYDVEKYIEAVKKLTPKKVQEVFSQLIDPEQFYLALYGPSLETDIKILK